MSQLTQSKSKMQLQEVGSVSWIVFWCRWCMGLWKASAPPVLCCVKRIDCILHPGVDRLTYSLTVVSYNCRCLFLMDANITKVLPLTLIRHNMVFIKYRILLHPYIHFIISIHALHYINYKTITIMVKPLYHGNIYLP